jgi:hypothetical protein
MSKEKITPELSDAEYIRALKVGVTTQIPELLAKNERLERIAKRL